MKNKNFILVAALLVLVAAIAIPKLMPEKKNYPDKLAELDSLAIDFIQVSSGDGAITLQRSGDTWRITDPIAYDAEQGTIERILGQLCHLDVVALTSENPDYSQDDRYELGDTQAVRIKVQAGGTQMMDARLGKASQDNSNGFARLENDSRIYRTAQPLKMRFSTDPSRWIKRDRPMENLDDLERLVLERKGDLGTLTFAKADSVWQVSWTDGRGRSKWSNEAVNESQFNTARTHMNNMRIAGLADAEKTALLNEHEILLTSRAFWADGKEHVVEWVQDKDLSPDRVYARIDGEDLWYEMYRYEFDKLNKAADEYRLSE